MFANASLRFKLLTAFLSVALFMVIVSFISYFSLKLVNDDYSFISEVVVENLKTIGSLGDGTREMQRQVLRSALAKNAEGRMAGRNEWFKNYEKRKDLVEKYLSSEFMPGEKEVWDDYDQAFLKYEASAKEFFQLITSEDPESMARADVLRETVVIPAFQKVNENISKAWAFQENVSAEKAESAKGVYKKSVVMTVIVSAGGVLFAVFVGYFFSGFISKIISSITKEISSSAKETSAGSVQLNAASAQLSQGASESAASIEETVSSLEELTSMVKLNSDHASEANSLSQRSLESAQHGDQQMSLLIKTMSNMSVSSKKIEEIINVIDDVAFQTNLLALNAAVEAARAGEQGKGFAVVADAVRTLAQRSADAAKDINTLIKENVSITQEGVKIADASGAALKEIVGSVKKVSDLNNEISVASQEQANGIEQISKAMNHLDQAIQLNASSSAEVAASSEEMSSQARCLTELVGDLEGFILGKAVGGVPQVVVKTKVKPEPALKLVSKTVLPFDGEEEIRKSVDGF